MTTHNGVNNLLKKLILLTAVLTGSIPICAQTIPIDPAVRSGKLANGFTYYIRKNNEPQKRVWMYLVNKAGSVLEDDDQQGLAHFMEHMNFNGTKHYPKNELIDYLQKAGIRFGADLNAHTSFDETVYELPIPTDDPGMTANGLKIMRDWAHEATLDPTEIEKERGVILEEERLGKGANDRMARKFYPMMLNHSRYADRLPIGKDQVLINFKPDVIKRFHHDWYRPDLQALIVVGDVNVAMVEKIIRRQFGDIKNPAKEKPRTIYTVPLTGQKQFLKVTDKEKSSIEIQLLFKHKAQLLVTEQDYLASMKRSLFNQLFAARRYAEISQQSDPAFVNMSASISPLLGGLDMFSFDVTPKTGQLQQGFAQAWTLVEKVKRYGFSQTEFDRVKQNYLRAMDKGIKEKDKTSSINYVKEYQELFLHKEAAPGITWEYNFVKKHLDEIKLADINTVMNDYLQAKDVDILVLGPESAKNSLPDEATINSWINTISKNDIKPYKDDVLNQPLLPNKPAPGKVVSKGYIPQINTTTLTLSNGVKVVLKPTDFKNDEIRFNGFAAGGTSLYNDADYDNAANAAPLISRFGLGAFNPVQLSKVLNGKLINVSAGIGQRSQNITGSTSTADLETALQLVYLQFTKPRKDSVLFNAIINNAKEALSNRYADPANVFSDTISRVMGDYAFRNSPSTVDRLNKISLQKAYDIYKERFADASGFTFTFVGNFDVATITQLAEQYLGALPALHKNEQARDLGIHIPEGIITKKVFKGTENKALVRIVVSGDYQYSQVNNLLMNALSSSLQIKLLQHLREEESEVYSPAVQAIYNKQPKPRFAFVISFGCAPKNVDHLINMVEIEMATLRDQGAATDDIQKYKAAYLKNLELVLKDNNLWLAYLSGQYENNENILQILESEKNLQKVTPATLQEAAQTFLSGKNMISFELLPESTDQGVPAQSSIDNARPSHKIVTDSAIVKSGQVITRGGITLSFNNNAGNFSEDTKQKMIETFFKVYPAEIKRFNPKSSKDVVFTIDPDYKGVAETSGFSVRINPEWLKKNPEDIDIITHEAMHIVQAYGNNEVPGWLTEGIADYVRYTYGVNNEKSGWTLPAYKTGQSYTNAYRVTARFLVWLEKNKRKDIVDKLNAAMRTGTYKPGLWQKLTGKTVDELWTEYSGNPVI